MKKTIWLSIAIVLLPFILCAQDELALGYLPTFQFDGQLSERLEYFFQSGSEMILQEQLDGQFQSNPNILSIDIVPGIAFDWGTNWNIAAAFLARRRNPFSGSAGSELRPWQQVTHISRVGKYRLRNRFRAEQRFVQRQQGDDFRLDHRLRYRLSVDFPLSGERLDDKEFYLNTSLEWLLTVTRERFFFYGNKRATGNLGYQFNKKNRLETGLELRSQKLNEAGDVRQTWFLRTTYVILL